MRRGKAALATTAGLCILMAGAATAQTSEKQDNGDIIVTATRREESLQKVPASVAVISADTIKSSGARSFTDLGFSAANVVFNDSVNVSGFRGVSIRGIQGRTGIYIDDVLIGTNAGANVSVNDVERVEILRGPQGTTFGRNTLAGAVNTVTRRPSFDWQGGGNFSYGNYGRINAEARLSGPLVADQLAFKVTGFVLKHDGYETDAQGNGVMTQDSYGFRGALMLTPAPDVSFLLSADYQNDNPIVNAYHLVTGTTFAENTIATSFMNENRRKNYGASFRADIGLGGNAHLVSISSLRRTRSNFHLDYDFQAKDIFYERGPRTVDEFSQEVRLSGGGDALRWLAGAYYYDATAIDRDSSFLGKDYSGPTTGGYTLGQLGLPGAVSSQYQRDANSSLAMFGSATVRLAERLKLTLGGRYSHDTVQTETYTGNLNSRFVVGTLTPGTFPIVAYPKLTSNRFTPSASLSYQPSANTNLYFTFGTGYQTGGFNASACNGSTTLASCQYRPEKLMSYELGYKAKVFNDRLTINLAAFYLDYRDLQRTQRFFYTTGGNTVQIDTTTNAAKARGKGVELEFQARPTDHLSFDGSVGYQETGYRDYKNAPVRVTASGAPQLVDLSGQDLPYAPRWTSSTAANYRGHYGLGEYRLRAELQYRDGFQNADGPFYLYRISPQTNVNLSVETKFSNGLSFAVRARNVLGKRYIIDQSYDAGFTGKFYVARSEPRTFWGEIGYAF